MKCEVILYEKGLQQAWQSIHIWSIQDNYQALKYWQDGPILTPLFLPFRDSLSPLNRTIEIFLKSQFVSSIPEFSKEGRLYELVKMVMASLLIYFKECNMHYGESHELCFALCYALKATDFFGGNDPIQISHGYLDIVSSDCIMVLSVALILLLMQKQMIYLNNVLL